MRSRADARISESLLQAVETVAVLMSGDAACDDQQLSIAIHYLHWTPPLISIVG